MKPLAKITCFFILGLFSVYASAEPVTVFYADGSTQIRDVQMSKIDKDAALMQITERGGGLTLDTSVLMQDTVNFDEISAAAPGQEVNLTTRFNAIGQLGVPFEQLLGRTFITVIVAPQLGISQVLQIPIEVGDENIVGYGIFATIPLQAPTGPFLIVGLNRIAGLPTNNDTATTVRFVSGGPLR